MTPNRACRPHLAVALLAASALPAAAVGAQSFNVTSSTYTLPKPGQADYDAGKSLPSTNAYSVRFSCPNTANGCTVKVNYSGTGTPVISPQMTVEYRLKTLAKVGNNDACTVVAPTVVGGATWLPVSNADLFMASKNSQCDVTMEFRVGNLSYETNVVTSSVSKYTQPITLTGRNNP